MVRCPNGHESVPGARACATCGAPMPAAGFPLGVPHAGGLGLVCAGCDAWVALEAETCPSCGRVLTAEKLGAEAVTTAPETDRAAAVREAGRPEAPPERSAPPAAPAPPAARPATPAPAVSSLAGPGSAPARPPPAAEQPPYEVEPTSPGVSTAPNFAAVGLRAKADTPRTRTPPPEPTVTRASAPSDRPPTVRPIPMPASVAVPPPARPAARAGYSMDARPCPKCGAAVPASFLFCGRCGARIAPQPAAAPDNLGQTQFFGQLQAVGKAKLVLIKGEGLDGVSYQLNAREHVAGRSQGVILFPDDRFLSPRHANFLYRDGKLFIRDEGSVNGVFVRIRKPVPLSDGDFFLAGEELLRFETLAAPRPAELVSEDGTVFYGTPLRDAIGCRLVQVLLGGRTGTVFVPTKAQVLIGRESCDLNFPRDRFLSGRHAKLEQQGKTVYLSDLGSKNGTYLRIREERELEHGDYVFLGQQLFRVEITAF